MNKEKKLKKNIGTNYRSKLEITHSISGTIKTSNWFKIIWTKRSFSRIQKEAFLLFENLLGKLKTDYVTMLLNLKIIQKDDSQTKTIDNIKNDPKCLLVKNKEGKISRNERCEATEKNLKIVVVPYKLKNHC